MRFQPEMSNRPELRHLGGSRTALALGSCLYYLDLFYLLKNPIAVPAIRKLHKLPQQSTLIALWRAYKWMCAHVCIRLYVLLCALLGILLCMPLCIPLCLLLCLLLCLRLCLVQCLLLCILLHVLLCLLLRDAQSVYPVPAMRYHTSTSASGKRRAYPLWQQRTKSQSSQIVMTSQVDSSVYSVVMF